MEDGLETIPTQKHAQSRPQNQAIEFTDRDEYHAGSNFPTGDPRAAIQIECDSSFTDLLVYHRKDVGACPNRQDVGVPDFSVEPVDHGPYHQAVQDQIEETVRDHES